ncbi:hypothetical protein GAGA_0906 [Paraglaciecola agarilytica NO2]|uniref:Uncharacterized protein n=1 Tax=Paraglaciecola agarilytica NO2 TaxID=1125747 RepID=A0ABQ0I358_9ALTE|nr:hypothetical protein GAGA_0906 [Paraglaciecola agarilytica NO2]
MLKTIFQNGDTSYQLIDVSVRNPIFKSMVHSNQGDQYTQ